MEGSTVIRELQSFWQDETGTEFVEWAVLAVILLAATVVVLTSIGQALYTRFDEILKELQATPMPTT